MAEEKQERDLQEFGVDEWETFFLEDARASLQDRMSEQLDELVNQVLPDELAKIGLRAANEIIEIACKQENLRFDFGFKDYTTAALWIRLPFSNDAVMGPVWKVPFMDLMEEALSRYHLFGPSQFDEIEKDRRYCLSIIKAHLLKSLDLVDKALAEIDPAETYDDHR